MFKRPGFYQKLKFSSNHVPGQYSEICDGHLYQDRKNSGILKKNVLSLQWYTDGASLFSSSNTEVWPVYLTINELPYSERYKKENLLVSVLWCGPVKPPGNILITVMYEDMALLRNAHEGEQEISGVLINGTADLPARAIMLNMVRFNGASSCQVCEQEGVPRPGIPGVRLFPFNEDTMAPRTLQKMLEYSESGTELKPTKGVKGPCGLASVMPNYVLGTGIDQMHQLFGGCTKKILSLWRSTKPYAKKWSISQQEGVVNQHILSIRPPLHVVNIQNGGAGETSASTSGGTNDEACGSEAINDNTLQGTQENSGSNYDFFTGEGNLAERTCHQDDFDLAAFST
ncbi:Nodulation protein NolW [Frankliniella fusca]|uniref:Nodulation protein NolW n=1 Tax=Frankliniella fusca TaxID=407009 RepID=A0AAE1HGL0_9NEOP|nr:Nodulation protein NolW [Frankliniella fusca]